MQKTTIVHLKAKRITAVLADSYPILIMFTVYITGIILGAALLKGNAKTIKKAETLYITLYPRVTARGLFLFSDRR